MSSLPTLWNAEQLKAATGGVLHADALDVTGISIDTRSLQSGDIFVALKGEQVDGHQFAKQAIDKGAAAVMVSQPQADIPPEKQLVVEDVEQAGPALAQGIRELTLFGAEI